MNKKEVISFLKEAKQPPSNRAVERCIASLPENKKPIRLLPLVKIQLASMPAGVYISAIAAVAFQIILTVSLHPLDALMVTGIFSALVAMLFGWHLMLSSVGSMIEVEKSCKYSYGQILMARLLCVSGLSLTVMLAAIIPNAEICRIGIPFILAAILPTIIGSLAALLWANYIGNSNFAQMAVYLVATLITGLMLKRIVEAGIILLCLILLTTIAVLFIQTKNLMNRRIYYYESYNY